MFVVYVCAYVREKVTFEVYGGESESMNDQYRFLGGMQCIAFCFMPSSCVCACVRACVPRL